MATERLRQAITELEKLPADEQDALAARILDEIKDERRWAEAFQKTADAQWDRLAASVRREVAAGDTAPLDDLLGDEDANA